MQDAAQAQTEEQQLAAQKAKEKADEKARKAAHERKVRWRTVLYTALSGLLVSFALFASGHRDVGNGFALGSALSLFSLFSLAIAIPFLLQPGMPPHASGLVLVVLFMKMPIYMIALYIVTRMGTAASAASIAGIALAPTVITCGAVRDAIAEGRREREAAAQRLARRQQVAGIAPEGA